MENDLVRPWPLTRRVATRPDGTSGSVESRGAGGSNAARNVVERADVSTPHRGSASFTESAAHAAGHAADRIDAVDGRVLAFLPEPGRRARLRAEAAAVAARWPGSDTRDGTGTGVPPLYGVPMGVKDVIRVTGLPTRAGSAVPADVLAGPQASVVDRLRAAGALVVGKTVTAEFAVAAPGPTRNPHHVAYTPGGSSSGSAAAVASGMVPLAIGTQTVGSTIRPAAYCGVVGFKPTFGRVPVDGVIANAPSLDTIGVFTTDVAGAALVAEVICDDWRKPTPVSADRRPVLAVPDGRYLQHATPAALTAFEAHLERLSAAGYAVSRVPFLADFPEIVRQQAVLNRYEVAQVHADWFPRFGQVYREQTARAIREGHAVERDAYLRALREQDSFRERLTAVMAAEGVDVWVTPSATGPAPRDLTVTGNAIMCLPWSFAGAPAISLPAGRAPNGLPLGVQCVSRPGDDERLLDWAQGWQDALATPVG